MAVVYRELGHPCPCYRWVALEEIAHRALRAQQEQKTRGVRLQRMTESSWRTRKKERRLDATKQRVARTRLMYLPAEPSALHLSQLRFLSSSPTG
jgi:hypothetical protein